MKALHVKLIKYLPLLSVLGLLGFTKDVNNQLNFHYFAFFAFLGAYWEYKLIFLQPNKDLLVLCQKKAKKIVFFLTCLVLLILLIFYAANLVSNYTILTKLCVIQLGILCYFYAYFTCSLCKKESAVL